MLFVPPSYLSNRVWDRIAMVDGNDLTLVTKAGR